MVELFEHIDDAAVAFFVRHGWVASQTIGGDQLADVRRYVDEVMAWPDDGEWLHYRELTDAGPRLCRTENFIPFHPGLRALLTQGPMPAAASALLGEPAVLYKEKINYKLAGGAGYAAHQDAPAYRFVQTHVSCMVAVDDCTVANGCLEVVSGAHQDLLAMNDQGCIRDDLVAAMEWSAVPVVAGTTLWFHSRTPHRSGPNASTIDRRAIYPTFNALSEGDLRAAYYRQKLAEFAAQDDKNTSVRVSLINDFQGRPV